jgi:hypothetical protein
MDGLCVNTCEHENAGVRVIELTEIEVCADCGIEIEGAADDDHSEED